MYLPGEFFCGLVFYELRQSVEFSEATFAKLLTGISLRGFIGGLILRGDRHATPTSGLIMALRSKTPIKSSVGKKRGSLLTGSPMSGTTEDADGSHFGFFLMWREFHFSKFAFDILAIMQGTYESGYLSTFQGFGATESRDR